MNPNLPSDEENNENIDPTLPKNPYPEFNELFQKGKFEMTLAQFPKFDNFPKASGFFFPKINL